MSGHAVGSPSETLTRIAVRAGELIGAESALYLLDIDGSRAVRAAGSEAFPDALEHGVGVGKDIPLESASVIQALLGAMRPGAHVALLETRGRGLGFLASDGDARRLRAAADEAAPWLELATGFTDEVLRSRIRRSITVEGMIQQTLLPPEIVVLARAEIAGSVLPAYDVGGDWFDHAVNEDGVWLGVGDGVGKGLEAAGLAAVSVGAFRAARANARDLDECATLMQEAVSAVSTSSAFVTCVLAHCHLESGRLRWINCGHPQPLLVGRDGETHELEGPTNPPLGLFADGHTAAVGETVVEIGDQLVLYTDGIVERRDGDGELVGIDLLVAALADAARASSAFAVASVQNAVLKASPDPLDDDSTLLTFRILGEPGDQA